MVLVRGVGDVHPNLASDILTQIKLYDKLSTPSIYSVTQGLGLSSLI